MCPTDHLMHTFPDQKECTLFVESQQDYVFVTPSLLPTSPSRFFQDTHSLMRAFGANEDLPTEKAIRCFQITSQHVHYGKWTVFLQALFDSNPCKSEKPCLRLYDNGVDIIWEDVTSGISRILFDFSNRRVFWSTITWGPGEHNSPFEDLLSQIGITGDKKEIPFVPNFEHSYSAENSFSDLDALMIINQARIPRTLERQSIAFAQTSSYNSCPMLEDANHVQLFTLGKSFRDRSPDVYIIIAHGLDGHALGTWEILNGDRSFLWVRDFLPYAFQFFVARDLTNITSISGMSQSHLVNVEVVSLSYVNALNPIWESGAGAVSSFHCSSTGGLFARLLKQTVDAGKPIVLIGHSTGGNLLECIVTNMEAPMQENVIFKASFGVPHGGSITQIIWIYFGVSSAIISSAIVALAWVHFWIKVWLDFNDRTLFSAWICFIPGWIYKISTTTMFCSASNYYIEGLQETFCTENVDQDLNLWVPYTLLLVSMYMRCYRNLNTSTIVVSLIIMMLCCLWSWTDWISFAWEKGMSFLWKNVIATVEKYGILPQAYLIYQDVTAFLVRQTKLSQFLVDIAFQYGPIFMVSVWLSLYAPLESVLKPVLCFSSIPLIPFDAPLLLASSLGMFCVLLFRLFPLRVRGIVQPPRVEQPRNPQAHLASAVIPPQEHRVDEKAAEVISPQEQQVDEKSAQLIAQQVQQVEEKSAKVIPPQEQKADGKSQDEKHPTPTREALLDNKSDEGHERKVAVETNPVLKGIELLLRSWVKSLPPGDMRSFLEGIIPMIVTAAKWIGGFVSPFIPDLHFLVPYFFYGTLLVILLASSRGLYESENSTTIRRHFLKSLADNSVTKPAELFFYETQNHRTLVTKKQSIPVDLNDTYKQIHFPVRKTHFTMVKYSPEEILGVSPKSDDIQDYLQSVAKCVRNESCSSQAPMRVAESAAHEFIKRFPQQ
eukprot:TRINITY_DN4698_c0_g1_i3.p1 TRINITY_DN4698_c0_g1~~TRINITY_DN4698_c0_g1_i3.p1  ORF type:complete len:1009 (+),score=199.01 TRINITY_DN4698_c0_g1_i3:200-3028(+)